MGFRSRLRWAALAAYSLCSCCAVFLLWTLSAAPAPAPAGQVPFQVSPHDGSFQLAPAVAVLVDGGFVVVWHGERAVGSGAADTVVRGRRFGVRGRALEPVFEVAEGEDGGGREAAVAADPRGGFVVVWSRDLAGSAASGAEIRARRFDGFGAASRPFSVAPPPPESGPTRQDQPQVALLAGGDFVVVWRSSRSAGTDTSGASVQARRFAPDSVPRGAAFQINDYTPGEQGRPAVEALPGGGFLAAWESESSPGPDDSEWSVQARIFAEAAGGGAVSPAGGQFQVNEFTPRYQRDPAVAVAGDGSFLVVWQSSRSPTTDPAWAIVGRLFSAAGAPAAGDFQVNTYTPSDQYYPSAAALPEGGFVVTWKSDGSAGPDLDLGILAQRLGPGGELLGGEFTVNEFTPGAQRRPWVATAGPGMSHPEDLGDFVIVWSTSLAPSSEAYGRSIRGRRFSQPALP